MLHLQMKSYWYLMILALCGFVTSFGAHIVATNLPPYAKAIGAGAFVIGLLIAVYDFAELFAKPLAGFMPIHGVGLGAGVSSRSVVCSVV